ncbi:MAG: YbaK/EbsC family protein [Candidatus Micrarchaeia archaeon]
MNTEDVKEFIKSKELPIEIKVFEGESTRTSELAANALGCTVAEIAKSIAFNCVVNGERRPVVVVISGDKKVDIEKLRKKLNASAVEIMKPEEVKQETGYQIGGVPPFPHRNGVAVVLDKSLLKFSMIWAAAGAPNAIMAMKPSVLSNLLRIEVADLAK